MNNPRRSAISKACECISEAFEILSCAYEEEKDAFDNLPFSLQCTERGELMETYIDILDDASSSLDDVLSCLVDIDGVLF